jgi:hypothetical protein
MAGKWWLRIAQSSELIASQPANLKPNEGMEARPDMDEAKKPEEGPEKATEEAPEATHSPIDFDKDGKASTQETAIAITLLVVGGGLLAWLMWLASQGQITEETIQPLIVVLAFLSGKEGFKRLSGGG